MSDIATIEIPDRPLFKAAEVCELLKVQPYVLRTWEAEFPELGIAKTAGAARVYRRGDVEQVMRIRHLLLVEGLTLAGARRKIDEDADVAAPELVAAATASQPIVRERIGQNVRERLTSLGLEPIGNGRIRTGEIIASESKQWDAVVQAAKLPRE